MYDFDGTLSPGNMQEYGFLDKLGESSTEFWRKSNEEARKFEMDPIEFSHARERCSQRCERLKNLVVQ